MRLLDDIQVARVFGGCKCTLSDGAILDVGYIYYDDCRGKCCMDKKAMSFASDNVNYESCNSKQKYSIEFTRSSLCS